MLAADTVVAVGRRMLGKPARRRRGRGASSRSSPAGGTGWSPRSRVRRGDAALEPGGRDRRALQAGSTPARSPPTSPAGEWQGKAGGYAIQGRAGGFVPWIGGSYSNVVGLPLAETLGAARRRRASRAGVKGRQILIEPLPAGGHAAALMVDGRLAGPARRSRPRRPDAAAGGDLPRASPGRPMKGMGGVIVDLGGGLTGFLRGPKPPAPGRAGCSCR